MPLNNFLPLASLTSSQQSALKFMTSACAASGEVVPAWSVGSGALFAVADG
jgi:hypothetical protein